MKKWKSIIGGLVAYCGASYIADVWIRPALAAKQAQAAAQRLGKPFLNVGCGTPTSSVRALIIGRPNADVSCDLVGSGSCGPEFVCHCDLNNLPLPWKDKTFGSVLASHCLEYLEDPIATEKELHRIADEVFIVSAKWWDLSVIALYPIVYGYSKQWFRKADGTWIQLQGVTP